MLYVLDENELKIVEAKDKADAVRIMSWPDGLSPYRYKEDNFITIDEFIEGYKVN